MTDDGGARGARSWGARLGRWQRDDRPWAVLGLVAIVLGAGFGADAADWSYQVGDIADSDIVAPVELRVPDPETTQARRDDAAAGVLDVYDFNPFAYKEPVASLNALFGWGREQVQGMASTPALGEEAEAADGTGESAPEQGPEPLPAAWDELAPSVRERIVQEGDRIAGLPLPEGLMAALWKEGFDAEIELATERLLRAQLQHSLLGTPDVVGRGGKQAITVRDIGSQQERVLDDLTAVTDLETARARLQRQVMETLQLPAAAERALATYLGQLLRPNLTYNSAETQARKQAAADAVDPVFYQVKRGRTIVREGDPVTAQALREIEAIRQQWEGAGSRGRILGFLLLSAGALVAMWRYTEHHRRRHRVMRVRRLYPLLVLMLVGSVWMTRLLLFVGSAVAGSLPTAPYNLAQAYGYAIPFAAAPLLVLLLVDAQVAWVYSGVQALVVGAMTGDVALTVFSLLTSFAAVHGMSRFQERTQMLRTALSIASVNVMAVVGLSLVAQPEPTWGAAAYASALGALGGIQVAALASAVLPALEWLFNTLTDVKLLELSNMNLPLLKQLAVVAPGTYHHSVVVGTLAEKAAEAIDANPLFARVAAYYHDVGKMRQPEYFVENQKEGRNPHDRLSPHMSALVLVRHVKDGVAYAQEHRLPLPLVDVIPQHHGTRLMRYFYDRALQAHDPEAGQLREEEFRYPGPKPQTKEAALIMLADGVEATSRTLEDPSPQNIRSMIRKGLREVLEDGQLDECEITLADLAKVEEAFFSVLAAMHHQRIEYPELPAIVAAEASR